eukprot:200565_1
MLNKMYTLLWIDRAFIYCSNSKHLDIALQILRQTLNDKKIILKLLNQIYKWTKYNSSTNRMDEYSNTTLEMICKNNYKTSTTIIKLLLGNDLLNYRDKIELFM